MSNLVNFPKPKSPVVDDQTVQQLESALALAKKGEVTGLVLFGWDATTASFVRWVSLPEREADKSAAAFRFIGGMKLVEDDLTYLATKDYRKIDDGDDEVIEETPTPEPDQSA